jgi:signal transduction histidine kinase
MIESSLAYRLPHLQYNDVIYLNMSLRQDTMNREAENSTIETDLFGIQQLKSRIVTQISHEFRTPLTSIIGFAAMLEENERIDENQRTEYARYIRNEGLRLAKIVNDLIELDALEQGRAHFLFEEFEIQKIIYRAAAFIIGLAVSKSITISKDLPKDPIISKCDSDKLTTALYQVLHNAIRFTKPGGSVTLKAETTDHQALISVQDNGSGIPVKDIPFLFKRFGKLYRPNEETHGTGVGLALAKHIIDQHGGDINVQSQVGEGSTFTIRIPIVS